MDRNRSRRSDLRQKLVQWESDFHKKHERAVKHSDIQALKTSKSKNDLEIYRCYGEYSRLKKEEQNEQKLVMTGNHSSLESQRAVVPDTPPDQEKVQDNSHRFVFKPKRRLLSDVENQQPQLTGPNSSLPKTKSLMSGLSSVKGGPLHRKPLATVKPAPRIFTGSVEVLLKQKKLGLKEQQIGNLAMSKIKGQFGLSSLKQMHSEASEIVQGKQSHLKGGVPAARNRKLEQSPSDKEVPCPTVIGRAAYQKLKLKNRKQSQKPHAAPDIKHRGFTSVLPTEPLQKDVPSWGTKKASFTIAHENNLAPRNQKLQLNFSKNKGLLQNESWRDRISLALDNLKDGNQDQHISSKQIPQNNDQDCEDVDLESSMGGTETAEMVTTEDMMDSKKTKKEWKDQTDFGYEDLSSPKSKQIEKVAESTACATKRDSKTKHLLQNTLKQNHTTSLALRNTKINKQKQSISVPEQDSKDVGVKSSMEGMGIAEIIRYEDMTPWNNESILNACDQMEKAKSQQPDVRGEDLSLSASTKETQISETTASSMKRSLNKEHSLKRKTNQTKKLDSSEEDPLIRKSGQEDPASTKRTSKKRPKLKKGEVSNNFVRMDLRHNKLRLLKRKRKMPRGGMVQYRKEQNAFRDQQKKQKSKPFSEEADFKPKSTENLASFSTGLDVLDQCLDAVSSLDKLRQQFNFTENQYIPDLSNICSRRPTLTSADLSFLERIAPNCPHHQRRARLLQVKKKGNNKGRYFYVCPNPRGEQCGFFMRVEDSPALLLLELEKKEAPSEWMSRQAVACKERFAKFTVTELKYELQRRGLKASGTKTQLLDRLVRFASFKIREDQESHPGDTICQTAPPPGSFQRKPLLPTDSVTIELDSWSEEDEGEESESDLCMDETEEVEDELPGGGNSSSSTFSTLQMQSPLEILQSVFGHNRFRQQQEWAIDRVLQGKSTMLVMATGAGKSLCYQLPSLLLPGLTLVVSPLISLMEDQLARLPPQLPGATLSGRLRAREAAQIVKDLQAGRIKVLFVSPERLCSPSFQRLVKTPGLLPEISLLCVDEAHCISQWSHNFRPAFLSMSKNLPSLRPRAVLGLTATASSEVAEDVCQNLGIDSTSGLKVGTWHRPNLEVQVYNVDCDLDKQTILISLLGEEPYNTGSVIIYVWMRHTAEVLVPILQSHGHSCLYYHGGMDAASRKDAQRAFLTGKVRIAVATVAFGLGIDKPDIRSVFHYTLPQSIEGYVQEIGRAGRDGKKAYCTLFLAEEDFLCHHSFAHSDGLETLQIEGLLRENLWKEANDIDVHSQKSDELDKPRIFSKQFALSIQDVQQCWDVKPEVLETLLALMELEPLRVLKILGAIFNKCTVHFRKKSPASLAKTEAVIGELQCVGKVLENKCASGYGYGHGSIECSLVCLSNRLGFTPSDVLKTLFRLQEKGLIEYSLGDKSYHVEMTQKGEDIGLDNTVKALKLSMASAEKRSVEKVEQVYKALASIAQSHSSKKLLSQQPAPREDQIESEIQPHTLETIISRYLGSGKELSLQEDMPKQSLNQTQEDVVATEEFDVPFPFKLLDEKLRKTVQNDMNILMEDPILRSHQKLRVCLMRDKSVLSRVLCRIFHSISSSCFQREIWASSPFWGRYKSVSFNDLQKEIHRFLHDMR